jgi:hypothetical protein
MAEDNKAKSEDQTLSKLVVLMLMLKGASRRLAGCAKATEKLHRRESLAADKRATPAICSCPHIATPRRPPTTNPQKWPPNSRTPHQTSTTTSPANSDHRVQSERAYQKQVRQTMEAQLYYSHDANCSRSRTSSSTTRSPGPARTPATRDGIRRLVWVSAPPRRPLRARTSTRSAPSPEWSPSVAVS